ncbi:2'-5' RNA ligase family protein [Ensifer sp. 4252]|uniref:2'-5' RNA ligase family protein n=1 Tax=Ensifer sp. 4252 TaxID=3373915 RepID=UPI003D25ED3E
MPIDQFCLDLGSPPPRRPVDLLYFAVLPDTAAAEKALRLAADDQKWHGAAGEIYDPDRLHVSLQRMWKKPGLPNEAIRHAMRIGSRVDAASFDIRFDRLVSIDQGRRYPRVLTCGHGSKSLNDLVHQLSDGEVAKGEVVPHMTLYYGERSAPYMDLRTSIIWTALDFALVHTRKGLGTSEVLRRWPLSRPT